MTHNTLTHELNLKEERKKAETFWMEKLSGDLEFSSFPPDLETGNGDRIAAISIPISREVSDSINKISNHSDWGTFVMLVTSLNVILQKYNRSDDILVGSTGLKSGADDPLLFRNTVTTDMTWKELLIQVTKTIKEAVHHQHGDVASILSSMDLLSPNTREVAYPVLIHFDNLSKKENKSTTNALINFCFSKNEDGQITGEIIYQDAYSGDFIRQLAEQFVTIIEELTQHPERKIGELQLISESEKDKLLHDFNRTYMDVGHKKLLHEWVEEIVQKSPDQVAIVFEDKEITYRDLNSRANELGAFLRKKGVTPNTFVGIMISPGIEMAIGLLAIMKAGGAYVPIDPKYPSERKEVIIQDSRLTFLLKETTDRSKLDFNGEIIDLEYLQKNSSEAENLVHVNRADDLAYCIYTSGTTGKPKGVMIQHKSITNNIIWRKNEYKLCEQDCVLQLFSFSFDGFVTSFFTPFVSGAQIILVKNDDVKNPPYLYKLIKSHRITHFISTPSLFNSLLDEIKPEELLSLKIITLAGEEVKKDLLKKSKEKLTNVEIANEYGPTENSVVTTICRNVTSDSKITIGKPIANNCVYILDKEQKLLPIGVPGELCISGASLAKGYVNNPTLTDEKMVPNPFKPNRVMYKTGDLARWLPDGTLEYLGRVDEQVKIRGFRIELKEIELHVKDYEGIQDVLVTALKDANESSSLCAYYIASNELSVSELRDFLEKRLPDYMIPSYFVKVDEFPLTINGKIDKKSLPDPKQMINEELTYQAPQNDLEARLISIWCEILGSEEGKIGRSDNLFHLGMHSLRIASFVSKIYREFEVSIPIHIMFELSTVKKQAAYISQIKREEIYGIEKVDEKDEYPLSSAQKRIFMIQALNQDQISYNMSKAIVIDGPLETERVQYAFNMLMKRHEALRTSFQVKDGEPIQVVHDEVFINMGVSQLEDRTIEEFVADFVQPFDLSRDPLLRVKLVKLEENKHLLLIDIHHIVSDGQSVQLLVNEFVQLYEGKELSEPALQYKDYASWQNEFLESEELKRQEQYWLNQYEGGYPVLQLPTDFTRPPVKETRGDSLSVHIETALTSDLHQLAAKRGTTLFMLLLAAYNVLLSKYSNQEDIIVGTPISGRNHHDVENMMGMFVNTLALRNFPNKGKTFLDFLDLVKQSTLAAIENQDYPFELLVEKLKVQRDTSRNPLFDTMFTLQESSYSQVEMEGLHLSTVDIESNSSKFDLSLFVSEGKDGLEVQFEYRTSLFKKESIERLSQHFIKILNTIAASPQLKLADIDMVMEEEKKVLLYDFNQTKQVVPDHVLLHQWFEKQAERTPNSTALMFNGCKMTYQELNEQANQLARKLRKQGVKEEVLVSVVMERSFEMVKSILAILKAGGAFVPIDPHHPSKRIETIIKDSQSGVVLTQDKFQNQLYSYHDHVIVVSDRKDPKEDVTNLFPVNRPENVAYVIYTSGSTGKPKGVMIEHQQVLNTLVGLQRRFPLTEEDAYLFKTPFIFDVSVSELLGWFFAGGRLVILEAGLEKDPVELYKVMVQERITHVNFVPSLLQAFIDVMSKQQLQELTNLTYVFVAGEALSPKLAKSAKSLLPHTRIFNLYGPTEASIYSTGYELDDHLEASNVPIGKPLDNTEAYILNEEGHLQPVGIPGELCISGQGVARGYHNDEKKTKEMFIPHPYKKDSVLYKTGDLVRWLPYGNIEYLGRTDLQVKIRGYRVEIGEIEYCILQREEVREVVVVSREDVQGNKYLCAYIVVDKEWSQKEWHDYLMEKIPDYMIPAYFVHLDKMPLSPNGKVDRKRLPDVEPTIFDDQEFVAPQNETEEQLVQIWSEVLGIEVSRIGVTHNFFELGGHSISLLKALSKMYFQGWNLTAKDLYTTPTIRSLAEKVTTAQQSVDEVYQPAEILNISPNNRQTLPSGKRSTLQHVLVTGATGFLGIHLMKDLLQNTNVHIYCLVRGPFAEKRLIQKVELYFKDTDFMKTWNDVKNQLHIIEGDITKDHLGLSTKDFTDLGNKIDTVIHAAAIVKHYGNETEFNTINVKGTGRIIDFCFNHSAHLHYVSTISISGNRTMNPKQRIFTENHLSIQQDIFNNVYIKSKFEAEARIIEAQKAGLQVSIYRVGNLMGRLADGVFQENIEENAFYRKVKFLMDYKVIPDPLLHQSIELTPVDICSKAIVQIMQTVESDRNVFHLFNHNVMKMDEILAILHSLGIKVTILPEEKFREWISQEFQHNQNDLLSTMIPELVKVESEPYQWEVEIDSSFTRRYLEKLDFVEYPNIETNYIEKLLEHMKKVGYIN
ncbi:non-ribosomal peptide synthetase [Metabacillus malikii]|uniref:Amino acid adenylation domain-containing protein/thioester reductase-like protein n=1 Tax=Metabacillus malikii TaxID=1504265 RepID=A0ABT9ZKQ7_9BACI|nr:non-ribosomal peptide synthetase [Metabacillus malikii]MDQ0232873.1 amino acid adenylation domain-containing protein/thioester reductase-like protein [Metabacillus malikii]